MRKQALNSIYDLALIDDRVVFIGSDLGPGVLDALKKEKPERFFMEGVSEQHIIGMAAGLAMEGFVPYVNTIATFLTRRCYEQVALDLCLQDLPVCLIANGGGLVYAPLGPTHLAIEDIALMRVLPNMAVLAPCDSREMKALMEQTLDWKHPIYIRLAKGGDPLVSPENVMPQIGKAILMREPGDALFVSTGVMTQTALLAASELSSMGISCGVLHMHTIKPLDTEALSKWLPKISQMVTIEEHSRVGGLGSAVLEFCSDYMPEHTAKIGRMGLPDRFSAQYGSQENLLSHFELNSEALVGYMRGRFQ